MKSVGQSCRCPAYIRSDNGPELEVLERFGRSNTLWDVGEWTIIIITGSTVV